KANALRQIFYTIAIQYIWNSSSPRLFFGLLFLTDPSFSVVATKQVASFCAPAHPQIRKEVVMADKNNPGQFGNRDDTAKQAQKGGEQSPGQFGASEGVDPHEAGKKAARKALAVSTSPKALTPTKRARRVLRLNQKKIKPKAVGIPNSAT